ncbi:ribose-phosphate diphosphokinase [Candidatus Undinarchaeota archaeon]
MILGGSASLDLANKIADELGQPLAEIKHKKFPDGEIYVKLEQETLDDDVIIVQSTHFPQYENFAELLFLAELAKEYGAKRIRAVVPYLTNAMQDKVFEHGEIIAVKAIANALKSAGVEKILTIDCHFYRKEGEFDAFGIPAYNLGAAPILLDHVSEKFKDLVVITPDAGSAEQAKQVGGQNLKKTRISSFEVEIEGLPNVSGKNVLILDDLIETGGTVRKAIANVRDSDASKIIVAATHAAFCNEAYEKIKPLADYVVTTDTIPHESSNVSVAKKIADTINSKKW